MGPERSLPCYKRKRLETHGARSETNFSATCHLPVWVKLENGYAIWDFRGQENQKQILDKFKQFLWRPRPRTLLSKEQQRLIRKNLREYSRTFDEEDVAEESNVSAELLALRKRLVVEWNAWRAQCKKDIAEERTKRGKTVGDPEPEEAKEEIAVWVDEVIEQIEEEILD